MTNVKNYDEIKEYLLSDKESLIEVTSMVNRWNGELDSLDVYENDEEFFELFFEEKPYDLVLKLHFGNYNLNDKYVCFDGYNNLESISAYDYEEMLEDNIDDIIQSVVRNVDNIDLGDYKRFKDLYELING